MCCCGAWCTCFHELSLSLRFVRSHLFVSMEGEGKTLSRFGHVRPCRMKRDRDEDNMSFEKYDILVMLDVKASFREVVWGALSVLCVIFVKDGVTMDWPLEIVGEMLIFV